MIILTYIITTRFPYDHVCSLFFKRSFYQEKIQFKSISIYHPELSEQTYLRHIFNIAQNRLVDKNSAVNILKSVLTVRISIV